MLQGKLFNDKEIRMQPPLRLCRFFFLLRTLLHAGGATLVAAEPSGVDFDGI